MASQMASTDRAALDARPGSSARARTGQRKGVFATPHRSVSLFILMSILVGYTVIPLAYLFVNSTKTQGDFFTTFGLAFGSSFNLLQNIEDVFTYQNGAFGYWLVNTVIYSVVGGGGAAILCTLAGYGIAKFSFPGRRAFFAVVLGAIAIPGTALALPTFLLFSAAGLTNTMWAVIIPSLISPFGLYLMWVFTIEAVPTELLEAARLDGASELRTFFTISMRLLSPGFVTVLLFSVVATWNNYFLPLVMLNESRLYPLTVGLALWNSQSNGTNANPIQNLIITASLLTIIPLFLAFLLLQRYWQSGLAAGSVKA